MTPIEEAIYFCEQEMKVFDIKTDAPGADRYLSGGRTALQLVIHKLKTLKDKEHRIIQQAYTDGFRRVIDGDAVDAEIDGRTYYQEKFVKPNGNDKS